MLSQTKRNSRRCCLSHTLALTARDPEQARPMHKRYQEVGRGSVGLGQTPSGRASANLFQPVAGSRPSTGTGQYSAGSRHCGCQCDQNSESAPISRRFRIRPTPGASVSQAWQLSVFCTVLQTSNTGCFVSLTSDRRRLKNETGQKSRRLSVCAFHPEDWCVCLCGSNHPPASSFIPHSYNGSNHPLPLLHFTFVQPQ